jgi:hypothetical protein
MRNSRGHALILNLLGIRSQPLGIVVAASDPEAKNVQSSVLQRLKIVFQLSILANPTELFLIMSMEKAKLHTLHRSSIPYTQNF